jgi:cyanophycinase
MALESSLIDAFRGEQVIESTMRAKAGAATVALLFLVPGLTSAQTSGRLFEEPAMGPLVLVGGKLESSNEPVFRAILGLRFEYRPICILPTSADNATQVTNDLVGVFERYGGPGAAKGVAPLFTKPRRADKEKLARTLENCGGFFFTDGDAENIVDTLRPDGRSTLAEQAILRVHRRGGVIAGSSAGAAVMSDTMIGSGSSDEALAYGILEEGSGKPGLWLKGGMGFFHGGLVDQRHMNEGRTGRLLVALAGLEDADRGFGIDSNTALVIDNGRARVVGTSQVIVLEEVRAGDEANGLDGARFRVLLLGNGDEYNLMNGTVSVGARKEVLRMREVTPTAPEGPWVATGLALYLVDLASSNVKVGEFASKGYRFTLTKETGFDARAWEFPDGEHVPHGFTAGWFLLDISRE